ncbi:hypothetical protein VIM7927_02344 [Vibrio mangrovi]|nr:hypothetical protein VIM7927_02344 [Vibrio mangrovi]
MRYSPTRQMDVVSEDQFALPAKEHFDRMRDLGEGIGFSMVGKTKGVFSKMVDKFEKNEGGYYHSPLLDDALRDHQTTAAFHAALKRCLAENVKDGVLDSDIVNLSSAYMSTKGKGAKLPHFIARDGYKPSIDLVNGTVLTVHGIWYMKVYAEKLEYKGNDIRGVFKYEIQDHFGLDTKDINHPDLNDIPFERLDGFRSWYLLQHYKDYGYKPFVTRIGFRL